MGNKRIRFSLSGSSIGKAIDELKAYEQSVHDKTRRLQELIAERVAWSASQGFSTSIASDIFTGGEATHGNVTVQVENNGNVSVVFASGDEAVFIEFGAGVYYNGAAGSSPHPKGAEFGFLIGEYGKKQGRKNVWALPGSTRDNPILTHGTPAAMPMYRGAQEARSVIMELAREVFG